MMINVWAQWCGPCREEAPYLAEVANDQQVRSAGSSGLIMMIRDLIWRSNLRSCPPGDIRSSPIPMSCCASALQISGPPQTFFVRPDGTIAFRHAGQFTRRRRFGTWHVNILESLHDQRGRGATGVARRT